MCLLSSVLFRFCFDLNDALWLANLVLKLVAVIPTYVSSLLSHVTVAWYTMSLARHSVSLARLASDIVYQATVTCDNKEETYVGITATSFKARFANHKASFKSMQKRNSTEPNIWELKDNNLNYAIKWKILCRAPHYSNKTKKCNLCLSEKYYILYKQNTASLNKKSELLSKCRHKEKFLLKSLA